jgi:acetoin utilization deacetylase AcuC-like enzyme
MSCVEPTVRAFDPDYLVVLLGMDALAGDELASGAGNWSLGGDGGVAWCTEKLKSWQAEIEGRKLMVLGGGGYNVANAARGWACATSVLVSPSVGTRSSVVKSR